MSLIKPAPLNSSFMLAAILGFLISVVYIRKIDVTWAFTFALVFIIMLIASLISMIEAPVRGQLMPRLERDISSGIEKEFPIKEEPAPAKSKPKKRKVRRKKRR